MTPEEVKAQANAFAPHLGQAQADAIRHIDRELNCSGHRPDEFVSLVVTLHRPTGVASMSADMSRESSLRLLQDIVSQQIALLAAEQQRKVMEN